ncbi:MAG: potassium channel protein [Synechococcus sp. SB0662_bin_45]|uniref:Potassium channel protein n=1 Tax=Synechococcus sp. SB0676_bin_10 TaxID=2604869 RepID=A0A6B1FB70_9SYNE|nr:potassium channel protein [Synechococcus sp. SB0668_bin_13]MXY19549.1 potassium channel protein [Synechococcus sp. SB0664_bin_36]MYE22222.1 potassium channel protein [Synechococcus sp. SB0662_bin_45]MYF36779.1 potassium channel protein [Synechococcus sp. SB0678_bin_12]MYG39016.1 potassium channel protein [Synechococcus sp. SB0676_bin_10]MYI87726.1 potassium channel protein [Synechococcus sp. SB0672_bin_10]MYK06777.1 potassium channel protein [Synechococcus sp. SB0670_bin_20]
MLLSRWRHTPSTKRSLRKRRLRQAQVWQVPLSALTILVVAGAAAYRLAEPSYGWSDAFWMTIITLTTVGYGEVHPLSGGGRLVTVLLLLGGVFTVQLVIQRFLQLSNTGYFHRLRLRREQAMLDAICDHVIICGYGRMGREVASCMAREDVPLLVIDQQPQRTALAIEHGFYGVTGDASLDEVLRKAGVGRARSLVAVLGTDADNVYVVLSAKALAPRVQVIARAESQEAASKLRRAGANDVVSPFVAGGRVLASKALYPEAVSFMEVLAGTKYQIERIQLTTSQEEFSRLPGRSLAEIQLGARSGVLVLAIGSSRGVQVNPGGQAVLQPGDQLILLGSSRQRRAAEALLGVVAARVDVLEDPMDLQE